MDFDRAPSPAIHMPDMGYNVRLISGNGNKKLAEGIASALGIMVEPCTVRAFADGEIDIHIERNVRGADVYVIQPTCPDVNKNLMELLLLIHTLRLSSPRRITIVVPYFGYARQDRKVKPRVPISASAVSQLIEAMEPHRIITLDLHCGQIQGFFHKTPVDNLNAEIEFVEHIRNSFGDAFNPQTMAIVSPDAGGVGRARSIADRLHVPSVVTILKRRAEANEIESMQVVGDVMGLDCVVVDDMIDTAGTLCKAAELLKSYGANSVKACATHGLFSGAAIERLNASCLKEVCVTDSIPQGDKPIRCPIIKVVSITSLLAEAIARLHNERSLSELFKEKRTFLYAFKHRQRELIGEHQVVYSDEELLRLNSPSPLEVVSTPEPQTI